MSSEITPKDEAELEAFLARRSALAKDYKALEPVEPPDALDARVLAGARAAAAPSVAKAVPARAEGAQPAAVAAAGLPAAVGPKQDEKSATGRPAPIRRDDENDDDDDDDEDDDVAPVRRPRWLIPAALAAIALVAVGAGVTMLGDGSSEYESGAANRLGSLFARRARERSAAEKAAAEAAAAKEAEVIELELAPLLPPPVFEPEGPQVEDLEAAIALVRRELVRANQAAAMAQSAAAASPDAASVPPTPPSDPGVASVIQPRDRRLAKILELYDGGNPDLAADSLEIFLRDFEDDPISQRIIDAQPRATDVAVE